MQVNNSSRYYQYRDDVNALGEDGKSFSPMLKNRDNSFCPRRKKKGGNLKITSMD